MIVISTPELLYTVRRKELEQMFNDMGRTCSNQRWSIDAINCYKRGCVCEGCPIREMVKSLDRCQMKATVLELVRIHGIPTKRNGPN